jgi:hypothetical protein
VIFKNQAGQGVYLLAQDANGNAKASDAANISATISRDGGTASATATAHPTEIGGGVYWLPLAQAETNGNAFAVIPSSSTSGVTLDPIICFTGAGTIPFVAAGAAGGLPTLGTGSGQINPAGGKVPATIAASDVTGNLAADLQTIKTQAVTASAPVTVLASVGTAATSTAQTGDNYARIGANGAGLTAIGDARLANLDATIGSRMATYVQPTGFLAAAFPATVASPTNITAGTITTTTNLTNLPAVPTDWLAAVGVKADAVTKIQAGLSTFAGGAVASVTAPVTLTTAYDAAKAQVSTASGQVVSSTSSSVTVSGLPSGKSYVGQHLYHPASGEARAIASQSFGSGNYTFNFTGTTGTEAGPFSSVTAGDAVCPTP